MTHRSEIVKYLRQKSLKLAERKEITFIGIVIWCGPDLQPEERPEDRGIIHLKSWEKLVVFPDSHTQPNLHSCVRVKAFWSHTKTVTNYRIISSDLLWWACYGEEMWTESMGKRINKNVQKQYNYICKLKFWGVSKGKTKNTAITKGVCNAFLRHARISDTFRKWEKYWIT